MKLLARLKDILVIELNEKQWADYQWRSFAYNLTTWSSATEQKTPDHWQGVGSKPFQLAKTRYGSSYMASLNAVRANTGTEPTFSKSEETDDNNRNFQ